MEPNEPQPEPEPHILTILAEKEKPSEEEARLLDLAQNILQGALQVTTESTINTQFLKLQNVVDQLVS